MGTYMSRRNRQPCRPHHIPEWAERMHLGQSELANAVSADRSLVWRWYGGATPSLEWQARLARFFNCEPEALFRHPNEEWLRSVLHRRSDDEIRRMRAVIELAFPRH